MRGSPSSHGNSWPSARVAWATLALLWFAYLVAFVDRLALALMASDIKRDIALSDTQIGLLLGFGFALFYTVCSMPAARLADRFSRKRILVVALLLWGGSTALAGFANSFELLLVSRIGVGLGEAALVPAGTSLIADSFPPERRSAPIGIFTSAGLLGVSVTYAIVGGLLPVANSIADQWDIGFTGWQLTFFFIASPTALTILLFAFLTEPSRKTDVTEAAIVTEIGQSFLHHLSKNWPRYIVFVFSPAFMGLYTYGVLTWLPSLMLRKHGWPMADTGPVLGAVFLAGGILAPIMATFVEKKLSNKGRLSAILTGQLLLTVALILPALAIPLAPTPTVLFACFLPYAIFGVASTILPQIGLQLVAPSHFRASVASIWVVVTNLMGLGLGPLAVAFFSDRLASDGSRLDTAMLIVGILSLGVAVVSSVVMRNYGLKTLEVTTK